MIGFAYLHFILTGLAEEAIISRSSSIPLGSIAAATSIRASYPTSPCHSALQRSTIPSTSADTAATTDPAASVTDQCRRTGACLRVRPRIEWRRRAR